MRDVTLRPSRIAEARSATRHRGISLIEVLTSLSVIALLLMLALPAIQAARETARRSWCASHLREIGTATHLLLSLHQGFPPNGGYTEDSRILDTRGHLVWVGTDDNFSRMYRWGIANPSRGVRQQTGSWCYALLPFVGQSQASDPVVTEVEIGLYHCPSRVRETDGVPTNDVYGTYFAGGRQWARTDYAANGLLAPSLPGFVRLSQILDGLSPTIWAGEKSWDRLVQKGPSWYWDESIYTGGAGGTVRGGVKIVADGNDIEFRENWGSPHSAGANFVFADSSVKILSFVTDERVLEGLLTPAGSERFGLQSP
jgi:prepilin-type N-terminal cleavage/methylation domain-containing protein/prepilin-type processing-associated H-X9-DG protein